MKYRGSAMFLGEPLQVLGSSQESFSGTFWGWLVVRKQVHPSLDWKRPRGWWESWLTSSLQSDNVNEFSKTVLFAQAAVPLFWYRDGKCCIMELIHSWWNDDWLVTWLEKRLSWAVNGGSGHGLVHRETCNCLACIMFDMWGLKQKRLAH